jgi:hypothetical protein
MDVLRNFMVMLAVTLTGGNAFGQARGPLTEHPSAEEAEATGEANRQQQVHDMAKWLPRLAGRYRLAGLEFLLLPPRVPPPPPIAVRGKADCVLVGSGPGVQCVIHVEWESPRLWSGAWLSNNSPTIILYGLDPLAARIRYLQVNNSSIAQQGEAVLTGDTLRFHEDLVNQGSNNSPDQRFQLTATAGDAPIKLSADYQLAPRMSLRVDMTLEREPQDAVD